MANRLTVGFVLDDSLNKPDGVQQYVLTIGRWLHGQGHEVHYLVGDTMHSDVQNVHSLSRNIPVRFNQNRLSVPILSSNKYIDQVLQRHAFDILHVQMPYSPLMSGKVIKSAQPTVAVVGTFHILPYSGFQKHASKLLALWQKNGLLRFDQFISVSMAAREFATNTFGIDSRVVPNVIDTKSFHVAKTSPEHNAIKIVFLGRLVNRKGCLELIQAIHQLRDKYGLAKRLKVKIGGTGPQQIKLEAYCAEHNLTQVELCGFVPESEKAAFLAQADIAVFPSTGGESFGIVLIEAMASGAGVVVGGDNPGYRTVLGDWPEVLVNPHDIPKFADRLYQFITDATLRNRIGKSQCLAAQQYDISTVGPSLIEIYKTAIAKRRRNLG